MRKLFWDKSFVRAFKRRTHSNLSLQQRIFQVLEVLAENPFDPRLKTHKLTGQLGGLWACWVEYDCRIVCAFEEDTHFQSDAIVLIDIGTHDEVY